MVKKMLVSAILLVSMFGIASATDVEDGFTHEGYPRDYILHIPEGYNGQDTLALVIALHGGGKNAEWVRDCSNLSTKADEEGFFVCYPNGTQTGAPGENNWNAGPNLGVFADDVSFISALIDTLATKYKVDTLMVYVAGFSAGSMMTNRLACGLAGKIAAVAPIAGPLYIPWNTCQPERLISIIYFHARNDGSMPYYGASWVASADSNCAGWANRLSCDIGPDTLYNDSGALKQTWTRNDDSCEIVFWTTEDGGHSWPGGYPYEPGADQPSDDIDANDLMWEFFQAHPIPVEEDTTEPGVQEPVSSPSFLLDPAYPGVFSQTATIRFTLGQSEHVTLEVFDVLGREIATVVDGVLDAATRGIILKTLARFVYQNRKVGCATVGLHHRD
jgi:polyhydroxybutyrate depolymerase